MRRTPTLCCLALALLIAAPSLAQSQTRSAPPAVAVAAPVQDADAQAFGLAIGACWNLAALPPEALQARITLSARFDAQGRPDARAIRLISADRGSPVAAEQLFQSARRALLRCGSQEGLPMPAALRHGSDAVLLTFDPAGEAFP